MRFSIRGVKHGRARGRRDRGGATFPELSPPLGIGRNFSAERAVAIHITNILNKLGLTSPLRMARWVAGLGDSLKPTDRLVQRVRALGNYVPYP
jgi:hypothetical protein